MKMVDGKLQLFDIKGTNSSIKKEVIGALLIQASFLVVAYLGELYLLQQFSLLLLEL